MTISQKYSIVKFLKCLSKIQSLDDLNNLKDYIVRVISNLNREINFSDQLEEHIKLMSNKCTSENIEFVKEWIFLIAAKAGKFSENQVYQYIAQNYLASGKGINETFTTFYSKYAEGKANPFTKAAVSRLFTVFENRSINKKVDKKSCTFIQVSYVDLVQVCSKIGLHIPRETEIL